MKSETETEMFVIESKRLNIWNVGGFFVVIAVTAFGWGITFNTMLNAMDRANERIEILDVKVRDFQNLVPSVTQLQYSRDRSGELITQNTNGLVSVNSRVDNLVENFGTKLDTINLSLNSLSTQVQVLSTQMKERQIQ